MLEKTRENTRRMELLVYLMWIRVRSHLLDEEGMGMVEIALIIIVLIGLAVVFKQQVHGLMSDIFDKWKIDDAFGMSGDI